MIKVLTITAILGCCAFFSNGAGQPAATIESTAAPVKTLTGISMLNAPAPPPPYVKSVQFRYNDVYVGAKFTIESTDGCPIFKYDGTSGTSFENVLGVMFKSDCGTTRTIVVSYNDNGNWVSQPFTVNL